MTKNKNKKRICDNSFKEEQEEAVDNEVDFTLARACKREIKEHCSGEDGSNILKCLKDFSNDVNFDQTCLDIIHKRIAQQSHDYRQICKSGKIDPYS